MVVAEAVTLGLNKALRDVLEASNLQDVKVIDVFDLSSHLGENYTQYGFHGITEIVLDFYDANHWSP